MKAILDSSFMISCAKRKIDFVSQLEEMGFEVVIPREVIQEMKDLKLNCGREERTAIDIVNEIIEKRKVKKIGFGEAGRVDEQLIKKGQEGVYIATLDAAIKRAVPNRIVISNPTNSIKVERD